MYTGNLALHVSCLALKFFAITPHDCIVVVVVELTDSVACILCFAACGDSSWNRSYRSVSRTVNHE